METSANVTRPSEREVRVERTVDAPRDLVWRAFSEPELLARWWARGNPMTVERYELRPGGHWRFVEHAPDGDFGFEGRFRDVEAPVSLAQTFEWDGAPGHVSVTTVHFEELDSATTRVVEDTMFMTTEDAEAMLSEGMLEGAAQGYEALGRLLGSMREGATSAEPVG